jgi:hypothetical protein
MHTATWSNAFQIFRNTKQPPETMFYKVKLFGAWDSKQQPIVTYCGIYQSQKRWEVKD